MATGMAGGRDDKDVPAHLRVTDEIPVGPRPNPEDPPPEAGASTEAGDPTAAGSPSEAASPTATAAPLPADAPPEAGPSAPVEASSVVGSPTPAGPPSGAARPVAATDVQLRPVVPPPEPPPRPYAPPVTVEEGIPLPPVAPRPPAGPPRAGKRPLARALPVGLVLVAALLMGVGFLLVYGQVTGESGQPRPCGGRPCAPPPSQQPAPPGAQIAYRTVERAAGYFEGTVTIVNHGTEPMRSWTLSFRYPGADIHNTWDAVLQRRGAEPVLTGAATARPIAPGATLEIRFGGSGSPSMPTDCRLNGAPCAFVAR